MPYIYDSKLFYVNDSSGFIKSLKIDKFSNDYYNFTISLNYKDSYAWNSDSNLYKASLETMFPNAYTSFAAFGDISVMLNKFDAVSFMENVVEDVFSIYILEQEKNEILSFLGVYEAPLYISLASCIQDYNLIKLDTFLMNNSYSLPYIQDAQGNTPLHMAYIYDNKMAAQSLLQYGCYINATNYEGLTLLGMAVKDGDYGWFNFARDNGGSSNILINDKSPLSACITAYKVIDDLTHFSYYDYSLLLKKQEYFDIACTLAHDYPYSLFELDSNGRNNLENAYSIYDSSLYNALLVEALDYL